ncbi:hypothetical protein N1851_033551 [Merluccius polli]|uniref:Uncharacterized protein n=1 Tax=Merluccius polli TaxID=89951 RepID=A0AA47NMH2_MERPO|nr:hypothetical protein N1851_033551 [Merluccius polli]
MFRFLCCRGRGISKYHAVIFCMGNARVLQGFSDASVIHPTLYWRSTPGVSVTGTRGHSVDVIRSSASWYIKEESTLYTGQYHSRLSFGNLCNHLYEELLAAGAIGAMRQPAQIVDDESLVQRSLSVQPSMTASRCPLDGRGETIHHSPTTNH